MGKPESFKQLLRFKGAKTNPPPVVLPKGGLVLTSEYIAEQARLKKEMLVFANALRCPICHAQLDGEVNGKRCALYCVSDPNEYTVEYNQQRELSHCSFRLSYDQRSYLITCAYPKDGLFHVGVWLSDLSLSLAYRERQKKNVLSYVGPIPNLDFPIKEEELLSELRLYAMLG
jgi:hypothetical protein